MIAAEKPVDITSIGLSGSELCGRRGSINFLNAIRPDFITKKCPQDLVPCSDMTSLDDTICVEESKKEAECPIINFKMTKDTE